MTLVNNLLQRVQTLESQVISLQDQIHAIETFVQLSEVFTFPAPLPLGESPPQVNGLSVSVIQSGYMHNFWGSGSLRHSMNLSNHQTFYLMDMIAPSFYQPLQYYQGTPTIGTLWIQTPSGTTYTFPLEADAGGIRFTTDQSVNNLPIGTTFRFTLLLILVPPVVGG